MGSKNISPIIGDRAHMQLWLSWQWSSDLVALLLAAWVAYVMCWVRVRRSGNHAASVGRLVCWFSGLMVVAIAVLSPIDELADSFLSVHMVQHILLIYVAPPLGLLAQPISIVREALARKRPGPTAGTTKLQNSISRGFAFILRPSMAWGLSTITLLVWHLPAAYDYALAHEAVHEYGEHLTLVLAFLVWWHPLIGSILQLPYLAASKSRFLYLVASMVPMALLGILILFWPDVFYSHYLGIPGALYDQHIGGLIMLGSSMVVLFVMGLPLQYYDKRPLPWP